MADLDFHSLGEQKGPVEDELKAALRVVFQEQRTVARAYLARLQYSTLPRPTVALCLRFRSQATSQETIAAVANVFEAMFARTQMLDIMPLNEQRERALVPLCDPFYTH